MNAVVAIVRANLLRIVGERSNLFFMVGLPLMIVFALGVAFGGGASDLRVGVHDPSPSAATRSIRAELAEVELTQVVDVASVEELRGSIARSDLDAGYSVERGPGGITVWWFVGRPGAGISARTALDASVRKLALDDALATAIATHAGVDEATAREALAAAGPAVAAPEVRVVELGAAGDGIDRIQDVVASGELTLFIFLTSLNGAGYLLRTRQLGVTRRMRAGPVSVSSIIAGEAVSRYVVALIQAVIVVAGSALLFGVDWRSPAAVALLSAAMALVGTGAGMLLGSLSSNEQQAGAIALAVGLVLAALGGSMQPINFFSGTLRTVAFSVTPHAWMNDGLWKVLVDGAGPGDVLGSVGVLFGIGAVLLGLAVVAMRRTLR